MDDFEVQFALLRIEAILLLGKLDYLMNRYFLNAEALDLAGIDRASVTAGYYGRNDKAADNHQEQRSEALQGSRPCKQ